MHPGHLAVILIFGLPLLIVGGFFLIWALKIVTGKSGRPAAGQEEETRKLQELHQGRRRMEERIEALETILLDPDRPDRKE